MWVWVWMYALLFMVDVAYVAVYFLWHQIFWFFFFQSSIVCQHIRRSRAHELHYHHTAWKCNVNDCVCVGGYGCGGEKRATLYASLMDKNWKNDKRKTTNTIIVTLQILHQFDFDFEFEFDLMTWSQFISFQPQCVFFRIPSQHLSGISVRWMLLLLLFSLPFCFSSCCH